MMNKIMATMMVATFLSAGAAQAAPENVQRFTGKQISERATADEVSRSADSYKLNLTRSANSMHHR